MELTRFFPTCAAAIFRVTMKIIINSAGWIGKAERRAPEPAAGCPTLCQPASFSISGLALPGLFIFQFPFPLLIGSGACVKNYANDIYYVAERARGVHRSNFHLLSARLMQFAAVGKWDYSKTSRRARRATNSISTWCKSPQSLH